MTAHHPPRGDVAVLVAAAGAGERLGAAAPKAFCDLAGTPLLLHALRRLAAAPSVAHLVVAVPPGHRTRVETMVSGEVGVPVSVVDGGATRQESVRRALLRVPIGYAVILVHDAARALAPPELVERVAAAVRSGHPAVIPVLPVVDTIKRVGADGMVLDTVDRSDLRAVQTPQGFRRDVLEAAHAAAAGPATDDAALAERIGVTVHCVPGAEEALKITRPFDLAVAELLLSRPVIGGGRTLAS
ncbi:MAG: 2-C-methyl-D-erythritol 4-phosphate cytidylyltransferase [Micromonosporaceae bacterium]